MPTYEYRCKDCGHEFEAQQAFSDDALTECPSCKGALKKKFGSVGIAFKGSGFYKNDSRGTASSTTPAATASASSTSDGASSTSESTSSATSTTSDSGSQSAKPAKSTSDSGSKPSSTPAPAG